METIIKSHNAWNVNYKGRSMIIRLVRSNNLRKFGFVATWLDTFESFVSSPCDSLSVCFNVLADFIRFFGGEINLRGYMSLHDLFSDVFSDVCFNIDNKR